MDRRFSHGGLSTTRSIGNTDSYGDSSSASVIKTARKSQRSSGYGDRSKVKWENDWDFILVTLCAVVSVNFFDRDTSQFTSDYAPSLIQNFLVFIFVVMPLLYMEIFLGQYTQLGPTQLRYLSPISSGLGGTLLIACIIRTIQMGLDMADALMYLVISVYPQWLICTPENEGHCLSPKQLRMCENDYCKKHNVELSTRIYWRDVYMKKVKFDTRFAIGFPNLARSATLICAWVIVYMMVSMVKDFKKLAKISFIVVEIFLGVLFFVICLTPGATWGIQKLMVDTTSGFFGHSSWLHAISMITERSGIGRAIPIMHGSYLSTHSSTGILTNVCVGLTFANYMLSTILLYGGIGVTVMYSGYIEPDYVQMLFKDDNVPTVYTVMPQALGFAEAKEIWTLFYFLTCLTLLLNNQLIHLFLIEKCFIDIFPSLIRYKKYLMALMIISFCAIGFFLSSREIFPFARHLFTETLQLLEVLNSFLISFFVCYVYGVQKVVDDMQFMTGNRPTRFWIICWYASPVVLFLAFSYEMDYDIVHKSGGFIFLHMMMLLSVISPIPLMLLVEIFRHLKVHNLTGIIRSHERWGPSDPEERFLRHMYNPRHEIRSRRRKEECVHTCLLKSRNLRKFIDEETQLRFELREMMCELRSGSQISNLTSGSDWSFNHETVLLD